MKLPLQQLENHLAKQLAPIYLVSGDELLLVQETIEQIRTRAQNQGFTERLRIQIESSSDWGSALYADTHSLSLFSTKRILELDLRGVKLTQANSDILKKYAENAFADNLLLIYANKFDQKVEQSKWYQSIEKHGVTIPIWPITKDQLPQWIIQRAKKLNLTFDKSAASWLAEQVEGNLFAAAQEIEKLRLLHTENHIDQQMLENSITDHARFTIFDLVDSTLAGNSKRALRILKNLEQEDAEPTLVLWALARELRTLTEINQHMQQGMTLSALFSQYRIWEKRQPGVRAFLKRHQKEQCWDFLLQAGKIDRLIKGADQGNVWNELQQLTLKASISSTGNA